MGSSAVFRDFAQDYFSWSLSYPFRDHFFSMSSKQGPAGQSYVVRGHPGGLTVHYYKFKTLSIKKMTTATTPSTATAICISMFQL